MLWLKKSIGHWLLQLKAQRKWILLNCTPTIRQFFRSSNHGTLSHGNPYAEENGGYAKSGPLPTVDMVSEQQLRTEGGEAIPTYSTVDMSKKRDKKKDKKAAEQKRTEDQDAVVDKSKKKRKKKNERTRQHLPWSRYVKEIEKGMLTNDCVCCCYLFSYPGSLFVFVLFYYITGGPTLSPFSTDFYPSQVETTSVSSHRFFSFLRCYFISRH